MYYLYDSVKCCFAVSEILRRNEHFHLEFVNVEAFLCFAVFFAPKFLIIIKIYLFMFCLEQQWFQTLQWKCHANATIKK